MTLALSLLLALSNMSSSMLGDRGHSTCVGESALRAAVMRILGPLATTFNWPDFSVRVDSTIVPGQQQAARLDIDWGDSIERRRLSADDCALLLRACAMVVAVAIETRRRSEPASLDTQDHLNRREHGQADTEADKRLSLFGRMGGGFTAGVAGRTEQTSLGAELRGELHVRRWSTRVALRYASNPLIHRRLEGAPTVRIRWWTFPMTSCVSPGRGTWRVPLCAGVELGWTFARGLGVDRPLAARRPWIAVELGIAVSWMLGPRLHITPELGVAVPLIRRRFHVDGYGPVYTAPATILRPALVISHSW